MTEVLSVFPWSVKAGIPWVRDTHRRLPRVQGAKWCIGLRAGNKVVGCALVGHAARTLGTDALSVLRVAVVEGVPNGCSMLYGACARAAKAMGASDLVTYTTQDEPGTSLRAAGWVYGGETAGGEHGRPSRPRAEAVDPRPKHRWWAPWSHQAKVDTAPGDG